MSPDPSKIFKILSIISGGIALLLIALLFLPTPELASKFATHQTETPKTPKPKILRKPKIRRVQPTSIIVYEEKLGDGKKFFEKGSYQEALTAFQEAANIEPKNAEPYEWIGDIRFAQKNYEGAYQSYTYAVKLSPSIRLTVKQIKTNFGNRNVGLANTLAASLPEESIEKMYYEGLISAVLNQSDKAVSLLSKVQRGENKGFSSKAEKILGVYEEIKLTKDPKVEYAQALIAKALNEIGEYQLSITLAFEATKNKNDYLDAWLILGHSFLKESKFSDAEDAFTKAINLDAGKASAYFFRGFARQGQNKLKEALEDFEKAAFQKYEPLIQVEQKLAEIHFEFGNFEKSLTAYESLLKQDASNLELFVTPIEIALEKLNQPEKALALAKLASSRHPEKAMAWDLLGFSELTSGHLEEAVKNLAKALELDPTLEVAYLHLGQLYEKRGKRDLALKSFEKAAKIAEEKGLAGIEYEAKTRYNELQQAKDPKDSKKFFLPETQEPPQSTKSPSIPSLNLL